MIRNGSLTVELSRFGKLCFQKHCLSKEIFLFLSNNVSSYPSFPIVLEIRLVYRCLCLTFFRVFIDITKNPKRNNSSIVFAQEHTCNYLSYFSSAFFCILYSIVTTRKYYNNPLLNCSSFNILTFSTFGHQFSHFPFQ